PLGKRTNRTTNSQISFVYDGLNPVQELNEGTISAMLLTALGVDEYFTRAGAGGVRHFFTYPLGCMVACPPPAPPAPAPRGTPPRRAAGRASLGAPPTMRWTTLAVKTTAPG